MGRLYKVLLVFVLLVGLALSFCLLSQFYNIPAVSDIVGAYREGRLWPDYILAGFCIAIGALFLLLLVVVLIMPSKSNLLIIKKAKGELQFSKRTVESTARHSFSDLKGVNYSFVRVKLNKLPSKIKVFVRLSINDTNSLAGLTEAVQDKIASTLKSSLGIDVSQITVKVNELNSNYVPPKDTGEEASDDIRVL
ncbi:MAG: alkaline shock response membrane anchor protein AmaP [Clostridiales bacterium]|jgi:uncharacterized alkaline shock family protein YloU|nr:alkaline shock response membrane anchor protein AmaP [Clostridiales bacterium]